MTKDKDVSLKIGKDEVNLPVKKSTIGRNVIDVGGISTQTQYYMYDSGFMSTASCESKITYINGKEGVLRYRGYDIKELAEKSNFLEVSYLLLNGDLPNNEEFSDFSYQITSHSMVNEQMRSLFMAFRHSGHPMAITMAATALLAAFYHDKFDINDERARYKAAIRIIAKMPTIAAMAYKYSVGQPFIYPNNSLGYTENFLHMMFSMPSERYEVDETLWRALDKIFILHADHEQNASTSTMRIAGSSGADPIACVSAAIASLWGPSHGGANEAVINMLEEIGHPKNIPAFIKRAKDKNDPFRLMGFGHRVYKSYDPRAAVLKDTCRQVLGKLGRLDGNPILEIASSLEEIALQDEYFIERKLYPNVDFYSGIIYKAMNIPPPMFTVLFAVARTTGWMSHWCEMHMDKQFKISRPRQLYTGYPERKFVSINKR